MVMTDSNPSPPVTRASRWRGWAINIALILLIFSAVQWWKGRPLAHGDAPPLAGLSLDGTPLDLGDYRGQTVLVHFWASWCPVCKLTDGAVDAIAEDHPVLTIAMQSGEPAELRGFMQAAGLDFRVIPDPDGEIASRWGVTGVPTSFVVDAAGRIRYATVGASSGPGLRTRLWLAERTP